MVATYSDVTERKQAVEREKRQQAEFSRAARLNVMGEMASALAHELGSAVSSCLNYLEGLILRLEVGTAEKRTSPPPWLRPGVRLSGPARSSTGCVTTFVVIARSAASLTLMRSSGTSSRS